MNEKFEYKVVNIWNNPGYDKILNEHGNKGWELVQIINHDDANSLELIFKRKIYEVIITS